MCYFISVGLPESVQQKWIDSLPQKMRVLPPRYEGISQKMKGFPVVVIATAMCSCDLFNRGAAEESSKLIENIIERYEKKGWSKSKIVRAIENRKKSDLHANLHPDFRTWLADATQDAGESYLFVHWDSDNLNLESKTVMSVEEFREETYIQDEHLIHIKVRYQNDNDF